MGNHPVKLRKSSLIATNTTPNNSQSNQNQGDGQSGTDSEMEKLFPELEQKIEASQKTKFLDLSSLHLSSYPPKIFELTHLTSLNVSSNKLTTLPSEIRFLTGLTTLKCNFNRIDHVPELGPIPELSSVSAPTLPYNSTASSPPNQFTLPSSLPNPSSSFGSSDISSLPGEGLNLKLLDLGKNKITTIFPLRFSTTLLRLELHCNLLTQIETEICQALTSLTALDLSTNRLTELPQEFGNLSKLKSLDIDNNLLHQLPSSFSSLLSLTQLNYAYNKLPSLPTTLFSLVSLQALDLHLNSFSSVPSSISELKSLTRLNLSQNQLTSIPPELGSLPLLQDLDLTENHLTEIPNELCTLGELLYLRLAKNNISIIPQNVSQLTVLMDLNLCHNQIREIPSELGQLTYLSKLLISYNQIKYLNKDLSGLLYLQELNLSHNRLTEPFLFKFVQLERLSLSHNFLRTIPPSFSVMTRLKELYISNNLLSEVPEEIVECHQLEVLNLWGNKIKTLPRSIKNLSNLSNLILGYNKFKTLPVIPSSLVELFLNGNKISEIDFNPISQNENSSRSPSPSNTSTSTTTPLPSSAPPYSPVAPSPPMINDRYERSRTSLPPTTQPSNPSNPSKQTNPYAELRDLYLGDNRITNIPENISLLKNLKILDLSANRLRQLPPTLGDNLSLSLTELNISHNKIRELPKSLCKLTQLKQLYTTNNRLVTLPDDFCSFKDRCFISIDGNDQINLPSQLSSWIHVTRGLCDDISFNESTLETSDSSLGAPQSLSAINAPKVSFLGRSSNIIPSPLTHTERKKWVFKVGVSEMNGRRPRMEDAVSIRTNFRGIEGEDFYGIFDGHGGRESAHFAATNLHNILAFNLNVESDPLIALKNSFLQISLMMDTLNDGTTAVIAYFDGKSKLYVANVGDSRAVLSRKGKAIAMSIDHSPKDQIEEERIKAHNGFITSGRVQGLLAVSRTLGDSFLYPYVTPEPFINVIELSADDEFLILACDGVWDVLSNDEAVQIVRPIIRDPMMASMKLRDHSYLLGSTDNISAMVIDFFPSET